jgi:hypothetical protein
MKRETPEQLQARMRAANQLVPAGRCLRHVRTGGEYIVQGHCLREGDLALMVLYRPLTGPCIVFSRTVEGIRAKFVIADGENWPGPEEAS